MHAILASNVVKPRFFPVTASGPRNRPSTRFILADTERAIFAEWAVVQAQRHGTAAGKEACMLNMESSFAQPDKTSPCG
ncbi:hypothetical protein GGTG_09227 [Gaeumannomyces tritici R3-111a-1]|uniref:Uncharacterized protein n=1 Tax=Gaeumannomyces tritici (strain R3-111a-1) TaxID=644352 RepID=J3P6T5_GAET3|nr:hypothetical protein GGTG_09227 [Gaeumannomyces tritici R3-111a-1]EJT72361.1 hypothetical protein GGTG_09227 [Gaeumannomyces tritici R3-111a-1]